MRKKGLWQPVPAVIRDSLRWGQARLDRSRQRTLINKLRHDPVARQYVLPTPAPYGLSRELAVSDGSGMGPIPQHLLDCLDREREIVHVFLREINLFLFSFEGICHWNDALGADPVDLLLVSDVMTEIYCDYHLACVSQIRTVEGKNYIVHPSNFGPLTISHLDALQFTSNIRVEFRMRGVKPPDWMKD